MYSRSVVFWQRSPADDCFKKNCCTARLRCHGSLCRILLGQSEKELRSFSNFDECYGSTDCFLLFMFFVVAVL